MSKQPETPKQQAARAVAERTAALETLRQQAEQVRGDQAELADKRVELLKRLAAGDPDAKGELSRLDTRGSEMQDQLDGLEILREEAEAALEEAQASLGQIERAEKSEAREKARLEAIKAGNEALARVGEAFRTLASELGRYHLALAEVNNFDHRAALDLHERLRATEDYQRQLIAEGWGLVSADGFEPLGQRVLPMLPASEVEAFNKRATEAVA